MSPPAPTSTVPLRPWRGVTPERAEIGGQRRVRLSMYLAFAALVAAVAVLGLISLRLEAARDGDAQAFEGVALQRTLSQQIGRQAALVLADPAARSRHAAAIEALVARARREAQTFEPPPTAPSAGSDAARRAPATAWQAARERLWDDAQVVSKLALAGMDDELPQRVLALQLKSDTALEAADRWSNERRAAAEQQTQQLRQALEGGAGALLALLGLLAIAVVEPAARSVGRHARRLAEQSAEVQRLALVAEHTKALVLISDADDRVLWVNTGFSRCCGWTLAESVGRTPQELLASPHADTAVVERVRQALRLGQGARHEWQHRARDGTELWLDVDLRPLHDAAGRLTGFVRVCSDVSARVQQQAKLQALWAALPAGVVVQSASGEFVDANRAAERLLGLSVDQMRGRDHTDPRWAAVREDLSPYPCEELPASRTLRSGAPQSNETLGLQTADGLLRWLLVNTEPQRDAQGAITGVVTCFSDITERRQLQDRLSAHARTDTLTQLPNRAVVMERLQRAIGHARRHPGYGFAVFFMDFDRFKQVNDTLGHGAGDELLKQVAARLQQALRPGDAVARLDSSMHVAARIGGDEFVVVLDGVTGAQAVSVIAERLLSELGEPYLIGAMPVHSSVSVGVVRVQGSDPCPEPDASLEDCAEIVLRNADTAMYEAKRAGRGRWVMFDDSMHDRVVRAMEVETDLRRAIQHDELFVVYQPVLELTTQAMAGVEALVRWRHPQRGLVMPADFIGVAEECGLIDAVGEIVLRLACTQFARWQRRLGAAAPRQLAVNLSRAQLERAGLVDDVRRITKACSMPVECLQLEVTETLAAQDERVLGTLRGLKSLGVKLALDDFGTGYSSLACLHLMPVDTVKIDRSFVRHCETVEYHRVLIEATIRVARTLGMTTVAEGIETAGQAALMQQLECDFGQGYLYARPLDADQLETWARQQHSRHQKVLAV